MPDRLGPRRRALAANLEHDARVVFEVVIPSGMIVEPRIGGDDDVPAVGLEVPDRCDSTLPRLPSRCCQQEHPPTLELSPPPCGQPSTGYVAGMGASRIRPIVGQPPGEGSRQDRVTHSGDLTWRTSGSPRK